MTVLIDTSFLLAAMFSKDVNHQQARQAMQNLKGENTRLVPAPVVYELFYMLATRTTYERAVNVFTMLQSPAFEIIALTDSDMHHMSGIMQQYADAKFDFADTALMAIADRLNIVQIYTFDHRDFGIYRPRYGQSFELLP